jgi:hypothetical protein
MQGCACFCQFIMFHLPLWELGGPEWPSAHFMRWVAALLRPHLQTSLKHDGDVNPTGVLALQWVSLPVTPEILAVGWYVAAQFEFGLWSVGLTF